MAEIELPWESEHVVEWTKCQLQADKDDLHAIVTLVSHLKSPTEFAMIVCINEEKPPQETNEKQGFLAKMKSVANSAASSAVKAQRAVTATNKLSAIYDVRLVLPVCVNVDFKINTTSLSISWSEIGPIIGSEPMFRQIKLAQLGEKFINSLKATVEISISKLRNEFVPNGGSSTFDWLWKYQPTVPLPASAARSPTLSSTADMIQPRSPIGKLMAFSWNVAGLAPPDDSPNNVIEHSYSKLKTQLVSFFKNKLGGDDHLVDVFVLSLQEASPLNAKTVMFKSENFGDAWIDFFLDCLESADRHHKKGEWIKISGIVQVGLVVTAFVRSQRANPRITSPMTSSVKTGTLGLTGNKGSVGIRFGIAYSPSDPLFVSVMNVHLASGDGKADFRKNELTKIINSSLFDSGNRHFFDSNLCIVNGDLNSRVAETETDGVCIPPDDEILTRSREEAEGFLFCESQVTFPATYKLIPGQEGRLVFFDNRRPGWCDRILYRSNGGWRRRDDNKTSDEQKYYPIAYDSIREIDYSDHSPVFGIFSLGVVASAAATASTISSTTRRPHEPEVVGRSHNNFPIDDDKSSDNDSDLYDN